MTCRSLVFSAMSLLVVSATWAQGAPSPGDIVINELLYDPPPLAEAPGEYVELFNRSGRTFDLSTLAIADSRDAPVPAASEEVLLAPGGYAVLVQDGQAFAAVFPGVPFVEPGRWPQLNNTGDTAQLLFEGTVIDAVPYTPSWGGADVALERIDPAGPSGDARNFGSSTATIGTPGTENTLAGDDGGPPPPSDATPPALESATATADRTALVVGFSEALDPASVVARAFAVEALGGGRVPGIGGARLAEGDAARVRLALSGELAAGDYALVVRGVRDAAGNMLDEGRTAFAVAPGSVPAPQDVVVNELWYAPADSDLEFVELFNRSSQTFDLRRFRLADDRREGVPVAEAVALLRPGDYRVLARDSVALAARFPGAEGIAEVSPWPALNNSGDAAVLTFATEGDTIEVDAVPYTPGWGGSAEASLERIDPAGPSTSPTNFGASTAPAGATPGAPNAIFARDRAAPRPVFAREVLGEGGRVFAAVFSEPLDAASVPAADFTIGSQTPAAMRLEGERRVRLTFGNAPDEDRLAVRGVRDLTGNALEEVVSVPLAFVAAPYDGRPPGQLIINELLYDPRNDDFDERPNQPEYVEVFNPTSRRRAFEGYYFTDRPDEDGARDSLVVGRARASIAPEGFAVIYAAGSSGEDSTAARLQAAFPEADVAAERVTLLPVGRASLGLLNGGGLVALRRPDGAPLDSVFYRPAWQSAAAGDADGRALERLDPLGPSNAASNWTTATAASGGTPGQPNGSAPPPGGPPEGSGVTIAPSPFSPDGDGLDDQAFIRYTLGAEVSLVRLRIYDSLGRQVYAREAELTGRSGQLAWDGRSSGGDALRLGIYIVLFEALDTDGGTVEVFKEPVVLARPLD